MKTIYFLLIIGFPLLVSCDKQSDYCWCCRFLSESSTRPLLPPPFDWENYNSVATVALDYKKITPGETIKIAGWIMLYIKEEIEQDYYFHLIDNPNRTYNGFVAIPIKTKNQEDMGLLKSKFESSDLAKKCYITGEFHTEEFFVHDGDYISSVPYVSITNVDNVFFE